MRLLARDHARHGIRVNPLGPGFVDTPFNAPVWSNFGGREGFLRQVAEVIPLGRMAGPEEIAALVRFVLSPGAALMTRQVRVVDGGELVS